MYTQSNRINFIPLFIILILLFTVFVFWYEKQAGERAQDDIREHAHIIADDLWNFNYQGAAEYLRLVAGSRHYEKISVISHNGEVFQEVTVGDRSAFESLGIKLKLIHRISLISPIQRGNYFIGWVEAIWIPQTFVTHIAVFAFLGMVLLVVQLYQRVLLQKRFMERRVEERTADLLKAKTEAEKLSQHLTVVGTEIQALLDNSPVGIFFVDHKRAIQRVNPEVTKITGYSQEELVGQTTRMLYASDEIYTTLGNKHYPILRRDGYCEATSEIVRKDGSPLTCYWRAKEIVSEDGMDGFIWSLEDISLRLKMEGELLKVRKLESIGVLAGGIAHDFNNILLAIIGNISLAEMMAREDAKLSEILVSARKASLRAKDLTAQLLTFSGGGAPIKITGTLPELLEESAMFVLSGSNVKCIFDFSDDLWPVRMDRSQINQVIQNLVVNADQSMAEGGEVTISCENIDNSSGVVSGLSGRRYVSVAVQDSGTGIPKEILDKIFDPYYSTKEKDSNKGSGLGLAVVHSIIKKHDGMVTVESTAGKGSRFTIYLPAINDESAPVASI